MSNEQKLRNIYRKHELATTGLVFSDFQRIAKDITEVLATTEPAVNQQLTTAAPVDEREAFEALFRERYGWDAKDFKRDSRGDYMDGNTVTAWMSWQARAALQSSVADAVLAEREACAKVCEDMHNEDGPTDYAWAIRARNGGV